MTVHDDTNGETDGGSDGYARDVHRVNVLEHHCHVACLRRFAPPANRQWRSVRAQWALTDGALRQHELCVGGGDEEEEDRGSHGWKRQDDDFW